jgi:uncharacterized protein (TIGR02646 family)
MAFWIYPRMIKMESIPATTFFNAKDQAIIDQIHAKNITGREKWGDPQFAPIYTRIKAELRAAQNSVCFYCQNQDTQSDMDDWHIDHIVPIDEDPRFVFTPANLLLACKGCNRRKNDKAVLKKISISGRYSASSNNYRIVHGRIDKYSHHMDILAGKIYISKTSKGLRMSSDCVLDRFMLDFVTSIKSDDRDFVEASLSMLLSDNPMSIVAFVQMIKKG